MKNIIIISLVTYLSAGPLLAEATVQSCNRTVTFDLPPERAVSNDVNLTEMMLVLGLADRMVGYTGISGWKTLDAEMRSGVKELPELSAKYPTKEVLVGADADFFFAGWNYGMKVGGEVTPETLKPFGIKVYELTESCSHIMDKQKASLEDMYNDILNLGKFLRLKIVQRHLWQVIRRSSKILKGTLKTLTKACVYLFMTVVKTLLLQPGVMQCPLPLSKQLAAGI